MGIDDNQFVIVKTISSDRGPTYIVQTDNEFKYMVMANNIDTAATKKRKNNSLSSKSLSSVTSSIPSASNWGIEQRQSFNIHFSTARSVISSFATEFKEFFDKDVPDMPEILPTQLAELYSLDFYDEVPQNAHPINKRLYHQSEEFQLRLTESTAEDFFKTLLEMCEEHPSSKVRLGFGIADLVIYRSFEGHQFMSCAIEIKGSKEYDVVYRDRCRLELVSYMISMAIENNLNLKVIDETKTFNSQTIYGILVIGLTQMFYRADIGNEYLDAIENNCQNVPRLTVKEFIPVEPYIDREFLKKPSRPMLLKSLQMLLKNMNFGG